MPVIFYLLDITISVVKSREYKEKCSDRSMENSLPAPLANYERPTDKPTDQQTDMRVHRKVTRFINGRKLCLHSVTTGCSENIARSLYFPAFL